MQPPFDIKAWGIGLLIGLSISLVLGAVLVSAFHKALRAHIRRRAEERSELEPEEKYDEQDPANLELDIHPWIMGSLERFFFTVLVIVSLPGTASAMLAWPALKLAHNWAVVRERHSRTSRSLVFASLLTSLLSMTLALIGGIACRLYAGFADHW